MAEISSERAGRPNVVAFLDMIAWSEGTDNGRQVTNDRGYDVLVGGKLFTSYKTHPNVLVTLNPKLKSTAAGRYQLLNRYYKAYAALLKLPDFSPLSQDLIAIQQIKERKSIDLINQGKIEDAIRRCANIWASLPGAGYGQFEHKLSSLLAVYQSHGGKLSVNI